VGVVSEYVVANGHT